MPIKLTYFIFIIGLVCSCGKSPSLSDKKRIELESEEMKVISVGFDSIVHSDTLWKYSVLQWEKNVKAYGIKTKSDSVKYKSTIERYDSLKNKLDTARLFIFIDDSLKMAKHGRESIEKYRDKETFKSNFENLDSNYHSLIANLLDHSPTRKIDIGDIHSKFNYTLKYLSAKKQYSDKIVTVAKVFISRVSFNSDRTLACNFIAYVCGGECGGGHLIFYKKMDGKWTIIYQKMLWVS